MLGVSELAPSLVEGAKLHLRVGERLAGVAIPIGEQFLQAFVIIFIIILLGLGILLWLWDYTAVGPVMTGVGVLGLAGSIYWVLNPGAEYLKDPKNSAFGDPNLEEARAVS